MSIRLFSVIASLLFSFLSTTLCLATEEKPKAWVGEWVLPTKPAEEIKFWDWMEGKKVFFTLFTLDLMVREEGDGKLRIHDGHREGWVDKAEFVLATEAPTYFDGRVKADSEDKWALFMRGYGRYLKGELDGAIEDYAACIRLDPKQSANFNARGLAWSFKEEHDKATISRIFHSHQQQGQRLFWQERLRQGLGQL
jgi:hypothetical protein